jgi:hypothetical protein
MNTEIQMDGLCLGAHSVLISPPLENNTFPGPAELVWFARMEWSLHFVIIRVSSVTKLSSVESPT